MVKKTIETFECDVCGDEGDRYTVNFPDGTMTLDRCGKHNKALERLRNEKGSWTTRASATKAAFKVTKPEDIARAKKKP